MKNALDKTISYFFPAWGLRRTKMRASDEYLETAYVGASYVKKSMRRWMPGLGSPNTDYNESEQKTLVARCRDAFRNQGIARAAVDRLKHNVVGTGINMQSQIDSEYLGLTKEDADKISRKIEREFSAWSESIECDLERELTFWGIQTLVLVSTLISGDVFVNTPTKKRIGSPYELKLQVIESDRVSNINSSLDNKYLRNGVVLDNDGAPTHYLIRRAHPGDTMNFAEANVWDKFPVFGESTGRRRILQIKDKERPGQYRGVPVLAAIIEKLKQLDRYSEAEITAAVISSFFTVYVESEGGYLPAPQQEQSETEKEKRELTMGPGMVVGLDTGEKISAANPGRPNTAYDPFVTAVMKEIGAALGLSLEFLMLYFQSSYSAARAALLQAWNVVKYHRKLLTTYLCQPVFELFLDELVASGRLELPGYRDFMARKAYSKASWIGPARGSVDELKEVAAAEKKIEIGISTRKKEAEEVQEEDWYEVHKQLVVEEQMRKRDGLSKADTIDAQDILDEEAKQNANV